MKYHLVSFLIIFWNISGHSQQCSEWILGYGGGASIFGNTSIDFFSRELKIKKVFDYIGFSGSGGSISDNSGNMLFFTNCISVFDNKYKIMINGDSINYGNQWDGFKSSGYPAVRPVVISNKKNNYLLFHYIVDFISTHPGLKIQTKPLMFTEIRFQSEPSDGRVIRKNVILNDSFDIQGVACARHGNGLDWWLLASVIDTGLVVKYLVDSNGVHFVETQNFNGKFGEGSQSFFSNDGTQFIRFDQVETSKGFCIFEFDRCTGRLYNPKFSNLSALNKPWTAQISESSSYLYPNNTTTILQYNCNNSSLDSTPEIVAVWDGMAVPQAPFSTTFFQSAKAINNRIYICATNSTQMLHVIDRPDLPGFACNVRQHAILLPTYNSGLSYSHTNYKLGPLKGSPCDTLKMATPDSFDRADHSYEVPLTTGVPLPTNHPAYIRQSSRSGVKDGDLKDTSVPVQDLLWYKMKN